MKLLPLSVLLLLFMCSSASSSSVTDSLKRKERRVDTIMTINKSSDAAAPGTCLVLLNGKKINRGSTLAKEDVAKLCEMIVIGPKGNMKPSAFNWVLSTKGKIWKGAYPSADACAKLKNLTSRLQKDDIVFIDSITFQGISGLCQEQFYLKVE